MRIVGYARVSSASIDGDSIRAQEEVIRAWAEAEGHEVMAVTHDSKKSGTLDQVDRPGLLDAVGLVEAGEADALVVHRLDRLARALHVQEAVLARVWACEAEVWEVVGNRLVVQDDPDDPMRTFVRQVMGAANQLERGMARARLQGGRKRKQQSNGYAGGFVRYGWSVVGQGKDARLVEVEAEQATLKRMRRLRKRHTFRAIAERLNADGIPARRGGPWRHSSVRSALRA